MRLWRRPAVMLWGIMLLGIMLALCACAAPTEPISTDIPATSEPAETTAAAEIPEEMPVAEVPAVMAYDDYYSVENAISLTSSDSRIVEVLNGNILHAVGIGSVSVEVNGRSADITVEKAKLAVFLCIGQSNMTVISTGNPNLAIKPARGTAYWKSPLSSRSLSSVGVKGLFGGFADQYYQTTGEKCLLIPAAKGGASIGKFQTTSDSLGNAINVYNQAVAELDAYRDRYTIVRAGYLWLQGETDCRLGMSSQQYLEHFQTMHHLLNSKCKIAVEGASKPFAFTGILAVRSWSGHPDYLRPANIIFTGPRTAQYALSLNDSLQINGETLDTSDIYLITTITENWYSDESVRAWFASDAVCYAEDRGIVKMIGDAESDVDALMPPFYSSASNTTYPDQHYLQKAYNEMGGDAGKNLGQILLAKDAGKNTVRTPEMIALRGFDGKTYYGDGDTVRLTMAEAVLVPVCGNLLATDGDVSLEFISKDCPDAKVNALGQISGLANKSSGELSVMLNGQKVMTVTVIMDDPDVIQMDSRHIAEESIVYLSDLIGTDKCLYWRVNKADSQTANPERTPGKDVNYTEKSLSVAGVPYEKGIGLHPQSKADGVITFDISTYHCDRFYAVCGSPKNATNGNGTICRVEINKGDGNYVVLAQSEVVGGRAVHVFDLDISGADSIRLVVNSNGNYTSDSTTWAYAMIYRNQ